MTAGTFLILWLLVAGASAIIGSHKGRTGAGLLLGLLLGLVGLIITACLRPSHAVQVEREKERLAVQREARGGDASS